MNYNEYKFSKTEMLFNLLTGAVLSAAAAWAFYRTVMAFFLMLPLVWFYIRFRRKECISKRKRELSIEFREAIMSVQSAMNAGYSVENAFMEAAHDMELMYGPDAYISIELKVMIRRLRSNESLEKILNDLGERSGIDDIREFAGIFAVAKRSGGNMNGIINRAVRMIGDKMEVSREIDTVISAKKYESRIMDIVPFGIIVYSSLSSPDISSVLYHNLRGNIIMTICLIVYAAAFFISEKIVDIEV